ncbi:MAG TPA: gas vesicle structural protein GvpA [Methylomirabilota bacterium]|jgi:hypothetical protein|nr:gas vesicle structural protein GvpA [Methylomirabilota bacterium]
MPVERTTGGTSLIDVLDRVLDKGIVIDAWVRVSLVGIDLITVEARIVVASIDTYLKYSEAVGTIPAASKPMPISDGRDVLTDGRGVVPARQTVGARTVGARRARRQ